MSDFSLIASGAAQAGFGEARTVKALGGTFAITAAMLALNKTTDLFKVPAGFTCTNLRVVPSDMDTNGTPTLVLAIGDAAVPDRLLTAFTGAQSGTANQTALAATGLLYQFTADTVLTLKATTAAATAAAGTMTVILEGYIA